MRFIQDGPSIPDELLIARDTDQVLFFCGAGVSRAKANLPDFSCLTERIINVLGSAIDGPVRKLYKTARDSEGISKISGLVPYDRIFGMLEREFDAVEIRNVVASALKPEQDSCLEAHQILLDLSRTREGAPRLVTTNFDLLFEASDPHIQSFIHPHFPDPNIEKNFRGIIHLHGCVNEDYSQACSDSLVLSSADFGRAYLSEGWATRYIQELLKRFSIVFVGYSADDPPVQYLLEALNRSQRTSHKLYAFQSGDTWQATQQWAHKGVEPIIYDDLNQHAALWSTLSAWSERALDIDGWHDRIIARAQQGPESMRPHERGMIAHLAATNSGSQYFANANPPLPASWLFVLDPKARYEQGYSYRLDETFDPFSAFGLDCDPQPEAVNPDKLLAKREVPKGVWDGMAVTAADQEQMSIESVPKFSSHVGQTASLPPRLDNIGKWIYRIANQPATLWWAAGTPPLHAQIQQNITMSLRLDQGYNSPEVRAGWGLLFKYWQQRPVDSIHDRYTIENNAKKNGWSTTLVQDAIELYQPLLEVRQSDRSKAPEMHSNIKLQDMLKVDVEYPRPLEPNNIPSDLLSDAVLLFRWKLENAVRLEREIGEMDFIYINSLIPDEHYIPDENHYGITGHIIAFTKMVDRLAQENPEAARREVSHWFADDPVFTRLRIWAGGRKDLTSPEDAGQIFVTLSEQSFWLFDQERDLLLALSNRWNELTPETKLALEEKIYQGNFPFGENHPEREKLVAYHRLDRIQWLSAQGVIFSFNKKSKIASLRLLAPDWTEDSIKDIAQPTVSNVRASEVIRDRSCKQLEHLPLCEVIEKAQEISKFQSGSSISKQPFSGYVLNHPVNALRVLSIEAKKGKYLSWAWKDLLSAQNETVNPPRLIATTGRRLAKLLPVQLEEIIGPASDWLKVHSSLLLLNYSGVFDEVWNAFAEVLSSSPESVHLNKPNRRWVDESYRSNVKVMLDALFDHFLVKDATPKVNNIFGWVNKLDQLLSLPGIHKEHATVIIASKLNQLFDIVPEWISQKFLPMSDSDEAFWAGFLLAPQTPRSVLFLKLKPKLIALTRKKDLLSQQANCLAGIILGEWGVCNDSDDSQELISDIEFREILIFAGDELRLMIIKHFQQYNKRPDSLFPDRVVHFFEKIWPRQNTLRTAIISGELIEFAFSIPERFGEIAPLILPKLVLINEREAIHTLINIPEIIFDKFPQTLLDLLSAVLGENIQQWFYNIGGVLIKLTERLETKDDPRLLTLLRLNRQRSF